MSLLWIIRLLLIIVLIICICVFGYFLKNRMRYQKIIENTFFNILLILLYNALCYVPVVLPQDFNCILQPHLFSTPLEIIWFKSLGIIIGSAGLFMLVYTGYIRRTVGIQDTDGKLLKSGIYSFMRHPIYVGIIFISIGLSLILINIDGMIVLPLIIFANFLEAKFEESFDMKVRFKEEYFAYKKQTRMFGPYWFWIVLFLLFIAPLLIQLI